MQTPNRNSETKGSLPLDHYVGRARSFALVTQLDLALLAAFVAERYQWILLPKGTELGVNSLLDVRFVWVGEPTLHVDHVVFITETVPLAGPFYKLTRTEEASIAEMLGLGTKQRVSLRGNGKELLVEKVSLESARYYRSLVRSIADIDKIVRLSPLKYRHLLHRSAVRHSIRLRKEPNADTTGFIFMALALAQRIGLKQAFLA